MEEGNEDKESPKNLSLWHGCAPQYLTEVCLLETSFRDWHLSPWRAIWSLWLWWLPIKRCIVASGFLFFGFLLSLQYWGMDFRTQGLEDAVKNHLSYLILRQSLTTQLKLALDLPSYCFSLGTRGMCCCAWLESLDFCVLMKKEHLVPVSFRAWTTYQGERSAPSLSKHKCITSHFNHGKLIFGSTLWSFSWGCGYWVTERYFSPVNVKIFPEFGSFILTSPSSGDVASECLQES